MNKKVLWVIVLIILVVVLLFLVSKNNKTPEIQNKENQNLTIESEKNNCFINTNNMVLKNEEDKFLELKKFRDSFEKMSLNRGYGLQSCEKDIFKNLKQNLILNLRLTLTVCVKIRICYNDWRCIEWKDYLH